MHLAMAKYTEMDLLSICAGGSLDDVLRVLLAGVDVNSRDEWHMTPLMHMCAYGKLDIAKYVEVCLSS